MPELPEVENVKLGLESLGTVGQTLAQIELLSAGLRVPFPRHLQRRLKGQSLLGISRRAKYLLLETEQYYLISHLGMTGSWRSFQQPKKHDHVILHFESGFKLVFNDPRRFGVLDLVVKSQLQQSRWLEHLGIEPLAKEFDGDYIFQRTRNKTAAIKGFLMDQRHVVGVGNIYASEALFAAGVRPTRAAGKISRSEAILLAKNIQTILHAAIVAGGSTIRDYRDARGASGTFQQRFSVYARAGEKCLKCGTVVRAKTVAGRNTFWCMKCQR